MLMKKLAAVLAIVGLLAMGSASAQISNSDHDFSANGYAQGEICIVCHAPHDTDTSVADAPLWDHDLTTGGAGFTPYSSATLTATVGNPDGISLLCLSCHDGTVAIDSFGGNTGSTFVTGTANKGTDLSDDHPISFTYDAGLATADGELHDPTTQSSGLGSTIALDMLFNNQLECASCHDVHNSAGTANNLLVMSNANSALCLTCHDK